MIGSFSFDAGAMAAKRRSLYRISPVWRSTATAALVAPFRPPTASARASFGVSGLGFAVRGSGRGGGEQRTRQQAPE